MSNTEKLLILNLSVLLVKTVPPSKDGMGVTGDGGKERAWSLKSCLWCLLKNHFVLAPFSKTYCKSNGWHKENTIFSLKNSYTELGFEMIGRIHLTCLCPWGHLHLSSLRVVCFLGLEGKVTWLTEHRGSWGPWGACSHLWASLVWAAPCEGRLLATLAQLSIPGPWVAAPFTSPWRGQLLTVWFFFKNSFILKSLMLQNNNLEYFF